MNKLVGGIFSIVLVLFLILMFINMSDDYDKVIVIEEFIAIENTASEEEIIVHNLIYDIRDIHIEGYHVNIDDVVVSINVLGDGSIILVDNVTGIGDVIEVTYSYQELSSQYTGSFIDVIPLIMIVLLVGGLGYILIKRG